jgi:hypothetical protein
MTTVMADCGRQMVLSLIRRKSQNSNSLTDGETQNTARPKERSMADISASNPVKQSLKTGRTK